MLSLKTPAKIELKTSRKKYILNTHHRETLLIYNISIDKLIKII